jgi:hypothetical protein
MMRVSFSEPRFVAELQRALRDAGYLSVAVGDAGISIADPRASGPEGEAELRFFVRAWGAARPEAGITLA